MSEVPSKSQIQWQCRRGMLELDFLLERFVNIHFDTMSDKDKILFLNLLSNDDPVLWDWLVEEQMPEDGALQNLVKRILAGK